MGGHDHFYKQIINEDQGIMVVKSGTDFKEFSTITLYFDVSEEEAKSASDQLTKENSEGFSCTYNKKTKIFTEVK